MPVIPLNDYARVICFEDLVFSFQFFLRVDSIFMWHFSLRFLVIKIDDLTLSTVYVHVWSAFILCCCANAL